MMENPGEPSVKRRHLRVEVMLKIGFRSLGHIERMINAKSLNLSRGGIFISTEKTPEKGRRVELELPGLDSQPVKITGTVRHVRFIDGQPSGVGIEFDELEGRALEVIDKVLKDASSPK